MNALASQKMIKLEDAILQGAKDGIFFSYFFLPSTFSLPPAEFHADIWQTLSNPANRHVCLEVFRDGAKTTFLRAFTLRGICYGVYKTILFLSESRSAARRSLSWIKNRILEKGALSAAFSLQIGSKDNADELEIINPNFGTKTTLIAQGITGQIRGLNVDDNRPDLIIADDIASYESCATDEALEKVNEIFFGAVFNALTAESVNPHSKLVYLGTRLGEKDTIGKCQQDEQFICKRYPILDTTGESVWPAKWSTAKLKESKKGYIQRNQLSMWMREKECKLVKSETTSFLPQWMNIYIHLPDLNTFFMGIDPVPAPSAREIRNNLKDKDWEVLSIIGLRNGHIWVEDQEFNKGHEVDWTIDAFFTYLQKYKPRATGVESVAYQRTLATLIRNEMRKRRNFLTQIVEIVDKRSKFHRISGELGTLGANGFLHVNERLQIFIQQFVEYPGVSHDDHLDSVALAIMASREVYGYYGIEDDISDQYSLENDKNIPDVILPRGSLCP